MKPLHTIKDKGTSIAIWETRNGGHSFSIQKRYKDKQTGEWKDSKYWFKEELESLIVMLKACLEYSSDRSAHEEAGIPSGQSAYAASEEKEIDIDDIPF